MQTLTPIHSPPASDTPCSEADFARASGVGREILKKLRAEKLAPDLDWTGAAGSPILLTPAGQKKLATLLALMSQPGAQTPAGTALSDPGDPLERDVTAAVASAEDRYVVLTVVRVIGKRNILARNDDIPEANVLVRTTEHFRPGMRLERCEPSTIGATVFHYQGRYPRKGCRIQ
jgi:hypothetical protein